MDADLVLWMRLYVPLIGGVALAVGLLVLRPPPTDAIESEIAIRYSFTLHRCHLPSQQTHLNFQFQILGSSRTLREISCVKLL